MAEAIESVLAQTEPDWELILVDNNASEETKRVAADYVGKLPQKIQILHEPMQGLGYARNRGIFAAKGQYIALLDDDDLMYPERLSSQVSLMEKNDHCVLSYGLRDDVSHDNRQILKTVTTESHFEFFPFSTQFLSLNLNFPTPRPSSIMVRADAMREIGGFDPHFNPFFLEDWDLYFRLSRLGDFLCIPKSLIRYRIPSEDLFKKKHIRNMKKNRLMKNGDYFYQKFVRYFSKKGLLENPYVKKDLKKLKARWLRENSFEFLGVRGYEHFARILLFRSLTTSFSFKSLKHLIRSFYPHAIRSERYRSYYLYGQDLVEGIDKEMLWNMFKGSHKCEFCHEGEIANKISV